MALRELLLKLGVDVDKKGEKAPLSGLDKIKAAAKVAAVAFAAVKATQIFTGIANEIRGLADEIDKTSRQMGIGTQALEELRFAAELAGVGGEAMANTLAKLQKNAFEAATGNIEYAETFDILGINVNDTNGELKSGATLLEEMSDAFVKIKNPTEKVGIALTLMGRSGKALIPLLDQGSEAIRAQRQEARELGGVLNDDLIDASVQLTDDQARLKFSFRGLKAIIAEQIIPVMIDLTQKLIDITVSMRGPLTTAMRFLGRIFRVFSTVIGFLNDKVSNLGNAMSILGIALGVVGVAFTVLGATAVVAAIKTGGAWIVANAPLFLLLGLLGLLTAAIFVIIEDFVNMGEGGESVFGTLITGFQDLLEEAGGWGGAMKEIIFNVLEFWLGLSRETFDGIVGALEEAITFILSPLEALIGFIINFFGTIVEFVKDVFTTDLITAFRKLWDNVKFTVMELVDDILGMFGKVFGFLSKGFKAVKAFFTGKEAEANVAGVSAAQAAPTPIGNTSLVNQPNTSVEVSVDASGQGNAAEIGSQVAKQVDAVIANRDRQTMQAFTHSAAAATVGAP